MKKSALPRARNIIGRFPGSNCLKKKMENSPPSSYMSPVLFSVVYLISFSCLSFFYVMPSSTDSMSFTVGRYCKIFRRNMAISESSGMIIKVMQLSFFTLTRCIRPAMPKKKNIPVLS